jgi:PqqA peptide cyclase
MIIIIPRAGWVSGVNAVVHRQNLERLEAMVELAVQLGAERLEVAHVKYYGWALANRAALLPSREHLDRATATVEAARTRLAGRLVIDYVVPDYYAHRPKACMGGRAGVS